MNYTKNHHLPQWAKSDRILMDDFNDAMKNIESGITAAQTDASQKPYIVGTYTPAGSAGLLIGFNFRPSFLIITSCDEEGNLIMVMTSGKSPLEDRVELDDHGFSINPSSKLPNLCEKGRTYEYIAFK